ncbi:MAG: bacterial Ig-like domain-containing protein, partial [Candidatus Fimimonas sp.]
LDGANAGFAEATATYTIGNENKPNPENVVVFGVKISENIALEKSDYTIDLGGLDFAQVGTYTITYAYAKNPQITATLTVVVQNAKYSLTVGQQGAGGVVSVNGGAASSLESGAYCEEQETTSHVVLVAQTRSDEYLFKGWFEVDETVATHLALKDTPVCAELTYEFDMPQHAYTVYAVFEQIPPEPTYLFSANVVGNGVIYYDGAIQPNGYQAELVANSKVTLTAVANEDSVFLGWFEPDETNATALVLKETPVSTSATQEFTVLDAPYTVYAVFQAIPKYAFSASVENGGYLEENGENVGTDYRKTDLVADSAVTLTAVANEGYEFVGWFTTTDVPELISASAEHTFTVTSQDVYVTAVFQAVVRSLILDGGADFTDGSATYTIGNENKPNPENVIVWGEKITGNQLLTKDVDYTIDLGGLNFEQEGTYTITYVYAKNTSIKATLTVEVVAPKFVFSAVAEQHGAIHFQGTAQPDGYRAELPANSSVTLTAVADEFYVFDGWYTVADVPELICANAEHTFVTGSANQSVTAKFALKIRFLWNDSSMAGFDDENKSATVTVGDEVLPRPQDVVIYGNTIEGDLVLQYGTDYTIDLDGLNFEQPGTYTIRYVYVKDTSKYTSLTIIVLEAEEPIEPVEINLSYAGSADPVKYNGGRAAYVFKSSILNNGEECDLFELGLHYEWRDHFTQEVVLEARDDTWDSSSAHYPSPAVVGTYDFVVYSEENDVKTDLLVVTRIIEENQFALVTDASTLSEYTNYTFIAKVGETYYAMSNPFSGSGEREAIAVTANENGVVSLGTNYEYVFRPYDSYKAKEDGLTLWGLRTGNGLNRTGTLILFESGGIEYATGTNADYTLTIVINEDGTATVHSPYCHGTLRLVYDETSGKYLFTAKVNDDARPSYPVYVYGEYTEPVEETKEVYEFFGKLSKDYDGSAVSFNMYKEVYVCTEYGETLDDLLKCETGRFVWTDLKGNVLLVGTADEYGNVSGPSEVGCYWLVFQTLEKGKDGMEWVNKAVMHEFEIFDSGIK